MRDRDWSGKDTEVGVKVRDIGRNLYMDVEYREVVLWW